MMNIVVIEMNIVVDMHIITTNDWLNVLSKRTECVDLTYLIIFNYNGIDVLLYCQTSLFCLVILKNTKDFILMTKDVGQIK